MNRVLRPTAGLALFRLHKTWLRRRGSYLAIVALVGVLGGVAMASVAGARRTQSSFTTFLASTNPSDLNFLSGIYNARAAPHSAYFRGYDPTLIRDVARIPGVSRVESYAQVNATGLNKRGGAEGIGSVIVEGSVDGEFFTQDRVTVVRGRMPTPTNANDVAVSVEFAGARLNKVHLPAQFAAGIYSNAQIASLDYGQPSVRPRVRLEVSIVGIVKFNDTIVQDAVDASPFGRFLLTPALTREALNCCVADTATYVKLKRPGDLAAVEADIVRLLPPGATPLFYVTSSFATKADQSIEPEAIALGAFGAIAALVTFLVAILVMGRQLDGAAGEREILRAMGASPSAIVMEAIIGDLGAIVIGAALALAVAFLLSPLALLGPVRPYFPHSGFAVDWLVFGLGAAVTVFGLGGWVALVAARNVPHRLGRRRLRSHSMVAGRLSRVAVLPAPALTGLRFALDSGSGSAAVPVRSAISGVILAVSVIAATLTFGASLSSLVAHPRLYGWNWNYEISSSGFGYADMPEATLQRLLNANRYVATWSGVYFGELRFDGITEPVIGTRPGAAVSPPILAGRGLERPGEVVFGAATLVALHKRIGQTITVDNGVGTPQLLKIVGTATLPTVGQAGSLHTTMGTGALLDESIIPAAARNPFSSVVRGPQAVWVRLRGDASPGAALQSLQQIVGRPSMSVDGTPTVQAVQRPAQIVNYQSMGTAPTFLALALAAGALGALGLTLIDLVRRRRRHLAILKALGFTRGQLRATVAWQASTSVVIGEVVGLPLGVVLGRSLWMVFANVIHVVPAPSVPLVPLALVAFGSLVLGNVVAFLPGHVAARTSTALLLMAE